MTVIKHHELTTNSLCVRFDEKGPQPVSLARAYETFSNFGEVARLEVPPEFEAMAVVSFYDVRAASSASLSLGSCCTPAPQYGSRTVELQGDVQLQTWMLPEIRDVRHDESEAAYVLDFFDIRAAERASKELKCQTCSRASDLYMSISERDGESRGIAPKYRNDLRLSEVNWKDLMNGCDKRTTLRLRFLPTKLCDNETLWHTINSAGLTNSVDSIRVFQGKGARAGSAVVNAVDSAGVIAITKYFHGRQWGRSMPVSVSFAAIQSALDAEYVLDLRSATAQNNNVLGDALQVGQQVEPWRVETSESYSSSAAEEAFSRDELGVSELSTEASDDFIFAQDMTLNLS